MFCRLLGVALASACVASDASAGLQSAIATAISGLQAQETTLTLAPQYPRLPYFWDLGPVPEGTLFVDPVHSTYSEAVYVDGPQLTYDPSTGAASLLAPPMLGPADEFGIRSYHSPSRVTLLFGESRVASPGLPHLTSYSRQSFIGLTAGTSFTATDYGPAGFELAVGGAHVAAEVQTISGFGGFQLDFDQWLQPGLDASLFAVPERPAPQPGELVLMSISIGAPLPVVGAIVEYGYTLGLSSLYLGQETVLAKVVVVPEPAAAAACLMTLLFAGVSRRRR
ncbi:hypothetical protein Pla108_36190 [Botrimarina colliarenosi]|uniref:PEP-CTERM protein-sorting domain-containing protein n=1 Tax=Botrimarina colliarenosi TaxID=2528001 RepID=A0A5C6A5V6_9BACT|nr:hypothetical protein [Botrimarina colliarenosi]TWT94770.1 hypothetical protein Pla108_36190 [Botrimarina colliarenosi]